MANNISSDGIGITETDASTANLGTIFKDNTAITSFNEFGYFSRANSSPSANMFRDCTNLEEIDLSNVTTIGDFQFFHTAITDINVPNLTQMSGSAQFSACHQLETVSSLGHISNIPVSCFRDCENLQSVVLQDECVTLSIEAFFMSNDYWQYGGSLQTVSGINRVSVFGESCFSRQYHLRLSASDLQSAVRIDKNAFWYVPVLSINCPKLTSLGFGAFRENKVLTNIECLGKISSIPDFCFNTDTALQTVKLPYECVSIGSSAFYGCSSLASITQYNKSLDDYAEGESPTFTNMSRITSFGQNCFYNCQSLSLTASDLSGAVSIGSSAFKNTLLSGTIDLPNIQSIGNAAFEGTKITSVTNLGSVTEIPNGCFYNCKELTNIIIRPGITAIGGGAFNSTNLSNIILPYGFEEFGTSNSGAVILGSCNNITYMQFPSTTTIINFWDIYRDGNPVTAYCVVQATTPPNTFRSPNNTGGNGRGWSWGRPERSRWYVPDSVVNVYKENEQWSPIADYIFPISQLETDSPVNWQLYQTNKDYGVSQNQ